MRTWILMLCAVSILCLAPAVWAADTAPADLGDDVARLTDAGGNPLAGCWRLKKAKYKRDRVLVKVSGFPINHNHWVKLIDKDGKVVAEKLVQPEDARRSRFKFKDVDCDGARHKVRAHGEGKCDFTKKVKEVCRQ